MARSIYIHWPFCARKCPYCDFNSHVREEVDVDRWQRALIKDMRAEAEITERKPLKSVFFGGGTPSLMPPQLVENLLAEAQSLWGFDGEIEITLEANPSSVEAAKFAALSNAGVNRISIGIQSFDDKALKFLGRLHSANEALEALDTARAHFERVSFDIIYALPGQSAADWRTMLRQALSFGTDHLSLYQLTIEPGTRFASDVRRGLMHPLDDDSAAELYEITQEMTAAAGLPAYEISNHAMPGQESRHNLTYWRYQDYIGIGPGAHGRRANVATERHKKPENYLRQCEIGADGTRIARELAANEQLSESLLMGLRLTEGVDLAKLSGAFSIPVDAMFDQGKLDLHLGLELLWRDGDRLGVTAKGMPLLNALLAEIIAHEVALA